MAGVGSLETESGTKVLLGPTCLVDSFTEHGKNAEKINI